MNVLDNANEDALLFNLVYCSCASLQLQSADIDHIVTVARRKNSRQHISGRLVYTNGIFIQWLEGKRDEVKRLMTVIAADSRHQRAVLVDAVGVSSDSATTSALQRLVRALDARHLAPHQFRV